jgi:taurine dioxygenase
MPDIQVDLLDPELPFGARIFGVTHETLKSERTAEQLRSIFEQRGVIVFEGVEPSARMQVALSEVFGPLKDHPVPSIGRVDQEGMPGVIDMRHDPETGGIVEVDGVPLAQWLPWHFDHCYNNELNRAGVLRALDIPPEGGLTLFADGIALYGALSPKIRDELETLNVLYTLNLSFDEMRFGRRSAVRYLRRPAGLAKIIAQAKEQPRAVHPAIWRRPTGEKVLHVSPWGAVGIEGRENPAGDALLEAVCQEIHDIVKPYVHRWKATDMLIWDNWRILHSVSGMDPQYPRRTQRTTIKGDYGLGYFENNATGGSVLQMTF